MIKSMTAFASDLEETESYSVQTEIRSYNHRHLDIALRVSRGYNSLEDKIKQIIKNRVARGRIDVTISIKDESEEACAYVVNDQKATAYLASLAHLKGKFNLKGDITLDHLLGAGGIIKPDDIEKDLDLCWPPIEKCVHKAFDTLDQMREKEGDYIKVDFVERLKTIKDTLNQIEGSSENLIEVYKEQLNTRIESLTKGIVELDPQRISQEAAILADKSDITEEIVRIRSHLNQFQSFIDSPDPAGRKLNFLIQELNREFNTIGSKTGKASVSHMIVDMKSELEKLREQIQNVE